MPTPAPRVSIRMGSATDWETMIEAKKVLDEFGVASEALVLSAHRTPDAAIAHSASAIERGIKVIIAGAGGAAHLAGVLAAKTILPVIGVPCATTSLAGFDSLLAIVQMPKGTPVATVAVGKPGAANAGFLAVQMLALSDPALAKKLYERKAKARDEVLATRLPV